MLLMFPLSGGEDPHHALCSCGIWGTLRLLLKLTPSGNARGEQNESSIAEEEAHSPFLGLLWPFQQKSGGLPTYGLLSL